MQRITAIDPAESTGKVKQLLNGVQSVLGMTPNLMKTLASSPTALEGYLTLSKTLSAGSLDDKFREQAALAVAQANSCECCLSAHSAIGKMVGLTTDEIFASRESHSADAKRGAGLKFAQEIVVRRGELPDTSIAAVRAAGYTDGEIAEIVLNVAINIFTNYFNHVAQTEVDFPRVQVELNQTTV